MNTANQNSHFARMGKVSIGKPIDPEYTNIQLKVEEGDPIIGGRVGDEIVQEGDLFSINHKKGGSLPEPQIEGATHIGDRSLLSYTKGRKTSLVNAEAVAPQKLASLPSLDGQGHYSSHSIPLDSDTGETFARVTEQAAVGNTRGVKNKKIREVMVNIAEDLRRRLGSNPKKYS